MEPIEHISDIAGSSASHKINEIIDRVNELSVIAKSKLPEGISYGNMAVGHGSNLPIDENNGCAPKRLSAEEVDALLDEFRSVISAEDYGWDGGKETWSNYIARKSNQST